MKWNQGKLDRIETVLQEQVNACRVAGVNALVWQGGEERYYCEVGYANLEAKKPIRRDSLFRLYSMTKPVTGAACMLLVERGQLDLLDPVWKYLPAFRNQKVLADEGLVPVKRDMVIQDLLGMTSGMPYGGIPEVDKIWQEVARRQEQGRDMTTLELAERLGQCPLLFHPGERWMYGASADIIGAVIEVASGKTFGRFLDDEFFEPLGMKDTGFYLPTEKQNRLANAYRETDQGLSLYIGNHLGIYNKMDRKPPFESGGAGLVSGINDYLRFTRMLLGGGIVDGVRILSMHTVAALTANQLTPSQRRGVEDWLGLAGHGYGRFMRVLTDPGQAILIGSPGEYGWDGWLGAYFANMPELDLSFLMLCQRVDSGTMDFTRRVRNIMMGAME